MRLADLPEIRDLTIAQKSSLIHELEDFLEEESRTNGGVRALLDARDRSGDTPSTNDVSLLVRETEGPTAEKASEILTWTAAEKLQLIDELWDEVMARQDELPVTEEQIATVRKSLDEYRRDPSKVTTWDEIKSRLLSRTLEGV